MKVLCRAPGMEPSFVMLHPFDTAGGAMTGNAAPGRAVRSGRHCAETVRRRSTASPTSWQATEEGFVPWALPDTFILHPSCLHATCLTLSVAGGAMTGNAAPGRAIRSGRH